MMVQSYFLAQISILNYYLKIAKKRARWQRGLEYKDIIKLTRFKSRLCPILIDSKIFRVVIQIVVLLIGLGHQGYTLGRTFN